MVKFKEFLVGDLFDGYIGTFISDEFRKDKQDSEYKIPLITSQTTNNGIQAYVKEGDYRELEDCLSISKDGIYAGTVFYQTGKFTLGNVAMGIFAKENYKEYFTKNIYLYLASHIEKIAKSFGGYSKKVGWNIFDFNILLPVTPEGTPDYAYMESYIKEMQRVYIDSVLEANSIERNRLLSIVDLDQAEYERVKGTIELCDAESYSEFTVGDFFSMESGKNVKKLSMSDSGLPVVQGGEANNGVLGYINEDFAISNKLNIIADPLFLTVARVGSAGYVALQNQKSVIGDNAKVLRCKNSYNLSVMLYFQTCLNKFGVFYDYSNVVSEKNYLSRKIKLPITSTGEVDYAYMEDYISKIKLIYIYIIENYLLNIK